VPDPPFLDPSADRVTAILGFLTAASALLWNWRKSRGEEKSVQSNLNQTIFAQANQWITELKAEVGRLREVEKLYYAEKIEHEEKASEWREERQDLLTQIVTLKNIRASNS